MIWQMFNKGLIEVQNSFSPISSLEMLIIRLIYLKESPNPEELISELSNSISKVESENSGDSDINSKVKEIMDFFPGAEVENID
jgi:DNA polymerase III gamma/tau subunit